MLKNEEQKKSYMKSFCFYVVHPWISGNISNNADS